MFQKNCGLFELNLTLGAEDSCKNPDLCHSFRNCLRTQSIFHYPWFDSGKLKHSVAQWFRYFRSSINQRTLNLSIELFCYKPYWSNCQPTIISRNCCMTCCLNEHKHELWRRGLGNSERESSNQMQRHWASLQVALARRSHVVQWSHSNTTCWSNKCCFSP